ncbi:MAG: nicotinate-nucleotide--dimethylbenzimidazole phosphoribosyltransferase [Oceanospirillaceae bacterium]|nr:nicotinate-nucleotide--dimethylbenzimidazole phosphoribosyltransferase [Oceanospirillaceae bacterium]
MTAPNWIRAAIRAPDRDAERAARQRQARLTKPAGALGELEALALRLAGLQGRECPRLERCQISVFAADHGIAAAGVSAYPQAVTAQMILNFAAGGAAVSVLARHSGARFEVVNLGTVEPLPAGTEVLDRTLGPGTADFSMTDAMTPAQLEAALGVGGERVEAALEAGCDLFIAGEMGIGNTSAATALAALLLDLPPAQLLGAGTGVDAAGLARKQALIERALARHRTASNDTLELLRRLGGFEVAAMTGACLRAGQLGVPVLVDGFIVTAAALVAVRLQPALRDWLFFSHRSAEPGHRLLLEALDARPLLALDMRLGEGSGAALAWPLLQSACRLHGEMATFDEAGVSGPGDTDSNSTEASRCRS